MLDNGVMGQKFRTGDGPDQMMMMAEDPREWLPPGHLAWKVIALAREMDLSRFGAAYRPDGQGGRPYHPEMMATLLLYSYCRGRRSSREIEMSTFDDVGARIICGGLHPDHSTVAEFVRRNPAAVLDLLPESVKACAREGLVSLDLVAGDGTKLKANAAMASNVTREQLDAQIAELEAWIDAGIRQWILDFAGDGDAGDGDAGDGDGGPGDGGPGDGGGAGGGKRKWEKKPRRAAQMLDARLAARARLDSRAGKDQQDLDARVAELAARVAKKEAAVAKWEKAAAARVGARAAKIAAGKRVGGTRPITSIDDDREVKRARQGLAQARADYEAACAEAAAPAAPDPEAKVNTADPSSQVMPLKKGGFDQLFNVQALATARTQVIIAVTRHPSPADVRALETLLAQARSVLTRAGLAGRIRKALFDAGYASDANFTLDIPETLYVAVTREARQTGRSPDGRNPGTMLPSWEDMTARLDTPEGKALYKQRAATIEPVFAQLTARLGRTLHYRGTHADTELALWAASHNILKAIKARHKPPARKTPTPAPAPALS
jgi:transposase